LPDKLNNLTSLITHESLITPEKKPSSAAGAAGPLFLRITVPGTAITAPTASGAGIWTGHPEIAVPHAGV
jgi:hypothetical protein